MVNTAFTMLFRFIFNITGEIQKNVLIFSHFRVNVLFIMRYVLRAGGCRMIRTVYAFVKDEKGVIPMEYFHVAILVTAVFVTAVDFALN